MNKTDLKALSPDAIRKILGIKTEVTMEPEQMAKKITVTFYPSEGHNVSERVLEFADRLKNTFIELGVNVIPYGDSLKQPTLKRRLKIAFYSLIGKLPKGYKRGQKIREGVAVVSLGEGQTGNLAMDNTMSFAKNTVITILDMPPGVNADTEFHKHFDLAMNLFTYHMTNIAMVVGDKTWIPYNFNASHPIYSHEDEFKDDVLRGLIPKIYAPIKPPKLKEFTVLKDKFDPFDGSHKSLVEDFLQSGSMLEKTNLYPPGKLLSDLPFRSEFYRWIGKIHLDDRNGMSFGFLARQMPLKLKKVYTLEEFNDKFDSSIGPNTEFFTHNSVDYVIFSLLGAKLVLEIPEVWVMTQRSGSKKTDIDPNRDLIKIGLRKGVMLMQVPRDLKVTPDYKPSFDTRVILAHAMGNALIGSILKYLRADSEFVSLLESQGLAMAHWHGYINPESVPLGWTVYGENNLPVSCSTLQSAIYALDGKLDAFTKFIASKEPYLGDIHIEPHHGSNITYSSLKSLANYLSNGQDVTKLGNYYLNRYPKSIIK